MSATVTLRPIRAVPGSIAVNAVRAEINRLYEALPQESREALDAVFLDGLPLHSLERLIWTAELIQRMADEKGIA